MGARRAAPEVRGQPGLEVPSTPELTGGQGWQGGFALGDTLRHTGAVGLGSRRGVFPASRKKRKPAPPPGSPTGVGHDLRDFDDTRTRGAGTSTNRWRPISGLLTRNCAFVQGSRPRPAQGSGRDQKEWLWTRKSEPPPRFSGRGKSRPSRNPGKSAGSARDTPWGGRARSHHLSILEAWSRRLRS